MAQDAKHADACTLVCNRGSENVHCGGDGGGGSESSG